MSTPLIAGAIVLLVLSLWLIDIKPVWIGLVVGLGAAAMIIPNYQLESIVTGGGWWCFAPMKAIGSRCIQADGLGVGDRNVCEESCTTFPERNPTIENIRKFISSRGMKFPLDDRFFNMLVNPYSDYAKKYRRFVATKHYRYMVTVNNTTTVPATIMERYFRDTGIEFIGELPLVCIKKGNKYHNNLKKAIITMEEKKSGIFGWWSGVDELVLQRMKQTDAETDMSTSDDDACFRAFPFTRVFLRYMHLITGADPKLYEKLSSWIENDFKGRTGVEVFFVDREGERSHRQVMVVDHNTHLIYYFEPNVGVDTEMKSIFRIVFDGSGYKIVDLEWENCPRAFQAVDRSDEIYDEYCQTWSMFMGIVFALNHPKFTKEQIFGWLVSLGEKALDVLIMFMYRIYMLNAGVFLTDPLPCTLRDGTVSQSTYIYQKLNILDTTSGNSPRQVRNDLKPCRNILRALVWSAFEAFGDLPKGGIRVDQLHYRDVVADISEIADSLIEKYKMMIVDRNVSCNVGEFANSVTDLITKLNARYMDTGRFGKILNDKLTSSDFLQYS